MIFVVLEEVYSIAPDGSEASVAFFATPIRR
jgi:hypothetical protein